MRRGIFIYPRRLGRRARGHRRGRRHLPDPRGRQRLPTGLRALAARRVDPAAGHQAAASNEPDRASRAAIRPSTPIARLGPVPRPARRSTRRTRRGSPAGPAASRRRSRAEVHDRQSPSRSSSPRRSAASRSPTRKRLLVYGHRPGRADRLPLGRSPGSATSPTPAGRLPPGARAARSTGGKGTVEAFVLDNTRQPRDSRRPSASQDETPTRPMIGERRHCHRSRSDGQRTAAFIDWAVELAE